MSKDKSFFNNDTSETNSQDVRDKLKFLTTPKTVPKFSNAKSDVNQFFFKT